MGIRKRDHLLAVAQRMFCATGFHAVSVDDIIEEAGVARMTLYKNFGSKEDLIVATLRREDKLFRQWLSGSIEALSTIPADRIKALFMALHERFASEGYYGCAFIRASIEFPDREHPVHRAAVEHREMIRSYLRGLAEEVGAVQPLVLAEQLYLLFEGAITASQLHGEPWPADYARQAAEHLVAVARRQQDQSSDQRGPVAAECAVSNTGVVVSVGLSRGFRAINPP
ncbi:MAG: TetR/AcrR family transcriptional regulator [Acidobacteriia bacterium]|nr:TetR/AcrR family transcriptional regulator [Terriglobia bacterium]